jgi:hypothetical protein
MTFGVKEPAAAAEDGAGFGIRLMEQRGHLAVHTVGTGAVIVGEALFQASRYFACLVQKDRLAWSSLHEVSEDTVEDALGERFAAGKGVSELHSTAAKDTVLGFVVAHRNPPSLVNIQKWPTR